MKNNFIESLKVTENLPHNKNIYPIQRQLKEKLKVLITPEEISMKIQEMAEHIYQDYNNKKLGIVCVEYGGREFYNLLIDNLNSLGMRDFYQGAVKMERGATKNTEDRIEPKFHFESGIVANKNDLNGINLLLVDDQISSGKTFEYLRERYSNADSVEIATLIAKSAAKPKINDIKYYSFMIKSRKKQSCRLWNGL